MDLLQLRYFQTVAKYEHMTKAAKSLYISQPSLSKTIRTLEKELGVDLFLRKGKSIKLSTTGKVYLEHVEKALYSLEQGKKALQGLQPHVFGTLHFSMLVGSPILPELLQKFSEIHPKVEFHISQNIDGREVPNSFDICLSSSLINLKNVESTRLFTERIMLGVPKSHHLAQKETVSLKEIKNERFILLNENKNLRKTAQSICELAGFSPTISYESDNPSTVRDLINAGLGVSFIPSITWHKVLNSSVVLLPIEEAFSERNIYLSLPKEKQHSNVSLSFQTFLIDFFSKFTSSKDFKDT